MCKLNWSIRACGTILLWAAGAIALPAQTFTTLHSFSGTDGSAPDGAPVQGTDGNFYATAYSGGANGDGTVFKITPSGTLTTIHSFDLTDGQAPASGLVLGTDGNFYGTTLGGGVNTDGTVFKITPSGKLTTLHSFCSLNLCTDGSAPYLGALVQGADGDFYGSTPFGGTNHAGTIFKITPGGALTTLHTFDTTDGGGPNALVQGADGNFYGTTNYGGTSEACPGGCGTVFTITPTGTLTTLHSFEFTDGASPYAVLIQANNGNFYGTTLYGGASSCPGGCGVIFEITPSGMSRTLHSFDGTDGGNPYAGLMQATDDNLYGTTTYGGANQSECNFSCGTVFKISQSGALTTLHSFDSTDGEYPYAGLFQSTNGSLYGTTNAGGSDNSGTFFSLSVGLRSFVEALPDFGKVSANIRILGYNLEGTTSVTFNGTPATFIVVSGQYIKTSVPAGAKTGNIQVTTPTATLTSNLPFTVKP
jgi:uncharacterized repeat protein (TIGR03803 family)